MMEPDRPIELPSEIPWARTTLGPRGDELPVARPMFPHGEDRDPWYPFRMAWISWAAAWGGLGLIMVAAALMVGVELFAAMLALPSGTPVDETMAVALGSLPYLYLNKGGSAFVAVGLLIALAFLHRAPWATFGLGRQPWWRHFTFAGVCFIGCYVGIVLTAPIIYLLANLIEAGEDDLLRRVDFINPLSAHGLGGLVGFMVLVAVHEEVLFRGVLLPYLRRVGLGWIGAVLVSSAIFAVLHIGQGLLAIPQTFALALIFASIYLWSRSLPAVIVAHAAFNVTQLLLAPWLLSYAEELSEQVAGT
ncbi:MAG: CPBP family intramembrane metalloprotease [Phycisphaerales bacterium]|nr:CPBP family intramembrane metalloprotease [Phycisphaerales bacterium]